MHGEPAHDSSQVGVHCKDCLKLLLQPLWYLKAYLYKKMYLRRRGFQECRPLSSRRPIPAKSPGILAN